MGKVFYENMSAEALRRQKNSSLEEKRNGPKPALVPVFCLIFTAGLIKAAEVQSLY